MTDQNPSLSGTVAAHPATAATVATAPDAAATDHPDAYLSDIAQDVALETLETMKLELADGPDAAEAAARVLLLAAVALVAELNTFRRERDVSDQLMQAVRDLHADDSEPLPADMVAAEKGEAIARSRLSAAIRAGLGDGERPAHWKTPASIVVKDGVGHVLTRAMLNALAPDPAPKPKAPTS